MDDIQQYLNKFMERENNLGRAQFERYSPIEIEYLIHYPFEPNSPIALLKGTDSDYDKIPILNQVKYLLNRINETKSIKLTQAGYLPTKLVRVTLDQNFLNLNDPERNFIANKELDSPFLHLTMNLMTISGLVKKQKGTISLPGKTKRILDNNEALFRKIFETFVLKYNWAYNTWGNEEKIGQLGFGFTLVLISKYGNIYRPYSFYAQKYFTAFPALLSSVNSLYGSSQEFAYEIYRLRSFTSQNKYFNLFDVQDNEDWKNPKVLVKKSVLFDRLIKCEPHKVRPSPFGN